MAVNEITGIRSAVAALDATAAAHAMVGGAEGFLASLRTMDVGVEDQQKYLAAREASQQAAGLWAQAAQSVRINNLPVAEAYAQSPGAGNKQAQVNE
jgi:hypothetical protein